VFWDEVKAPGGGPVTSPKSNPLGEKSKRKIWGTQRKRTQGGPINEKKNSKTV